MAGEAKSFRFADQFSIWIEKSLISSYEAVDWKHNLIEASSSLFSAACSWAELSWVVVV